MAGHGEGLLKYLEVLIRAYPEPLSRAELAKRSGVTKAAITKECRVLYRFCNRESFELKKLVLDCNLRVGIAVAWAFFASGRLDVFLESAYFDMLVKDPAIYEAISRACSSSSTRFSRDEAEAAIRALLTNLASLGSASADGAPF